MWTGQSDLHEMADNLWTMPSNTFPYIKVCVSELHWILFQWVQSSLFSTWCGIKKLFWHYQHMVKSSCIFAHLKIKAKQELYTSANRITYNHSIFSGHGLGLPKLCSLISSLGKDSFIWMYLLDFLITLIIPRCPCSWAVVTYVKYECDIQ